MITLRLSRGAAASKSSVYRVADRLLVSDEEIDLLHPFSAPGPSPNVALVPSSAEPHDLSAPSIYHGRTEIAGRACDVECWAGPQGYRLRFGGGETFGVTPDGALIVRLSDRPRDSDTEDFLEPPLILALALQGIFCLHAGAVEIDGQAVAFLGNSGAGKSTLAAFLSGDSSGPAQRLADDLLPIALDAARVVALPSFPQRKLEGAESYGGPTPRLPLVAVYVIDLPADLPEEGAIRIQPVRSADAVLALVRHTVATRLFDSNALTRHMAFCAQTVAKVSVRRLLYPRVLDALPGVEDKIRRDLQSLTAA